MTFLLACIDLPRCDVLFSVLFFTKRGAGLQLTPVTRRHISTACLWKI